MTMKIVVKHAAPPKKESKWNLLFVSQMKFSKIACGKRDHFKKEIEQFRHHGEMGRTDTKWFPFSTFRQPLIVGELECEKAGGSI